MDVFRIFESLKDGPQIIFIKVCFHSANTVHPPICHIFIAKKTADKSGCDKLEDLQRYYFSPYFQNYHPV